MITLIALTAEPRLMAQVDGPVPDRDIAVPSQIALHRAQPALERARQRPHRPDILTLLHELPIHRRDVPAPRQQQLDRPLARDNPAPRPRRRLSGADLCAIASRSTTLDCISACDPPVSSPISTSPHRLDGPNHTNAEALNPKSCRSRPDSRNLR